MRVKEIKGKFVPRRKIWKLHEGSISSNFRSHVKEFKEDVARLMSLRSMHYLVLKGVLQKLSGRVCG